MNTAPLIHKDSAKPSEHWRKIPDTSTIRMRERCLLRSLFYFHDDERWGKWGPNLTSALAWMAKGEMCDGAYFDVAQAVLELKVKLGRMPTEAAVVDLLSRQIERDEQVPDWRKEKDKAEMRTKLGNLIDGMSLSGESQPEPLPISVIESESIDMIAFYKGRSMWRLVAQAEQKMRANFADAVQLAGELKKELEKVL